MSARACEECGAEIPAKRERRHAKTCGAECEAKRERWRKRRPPPTTPKTCVICGASFFPSPTGRHRKVCSEPCMKMQARAKANASRKQRIAAARTHTCSRMGCIVTTTAADPICLRHLPVFDRDPPAPKRRATTAEIEHYAYGSSWSNVE